MDDLITFLRAREKEREEKALDVVRALHIHDVPNAPREVEARRRTADADWVRLDVGAKRRIVAVYEALRERKHADEEGSIQWYETKAYELVVKDLASAWSSHEDYDAERWAP